MDLSSKTHLQASKARRFTTRHPIGLHETLSRFIGVYPSIEPSPMWLARPQVLCSTATGCSNASNRRPPRSNIMSGSIMGSGTMPSTSCLSCRRIVPERPALLPQTTSRIAPLARAPRQPVICTAVVEAAAVDAPERTGGQGLDLWNRTYYPKLLDTKKENKPWYVVDAEGQTLGRLATCVANHIRGKTVVGYSPSMNMGAYVVVINAEKVEVSGAKADQKMYRRHSGRPGGLKEETFRQLQKRIPERIVEKAVRGMLPSGRIGNTLFNQLKVVKGSSHPHSAQGPMDITYKINKDPKGAAPPS